jgi:hypothetical protein
MLGQSSDARVRRTPKTTEKKCVKANACACVLTIGLAMLLGVVSCRDSQVQVPITEQATTKVLPTDTGKVVHAPSPTRSVHLTAVSTVSEAAGTVTPIVEPWPAPEKLDPLFRESWAQVAENEILTVDLCFREAPDQESLAQLNINNFEAGMVGPVLGTGQPPCWAVRVRVPPSSLVSMAKLTEIYRIVLLEPTPDLGSLSKLDAQLRILVRYRECGSMVTVFVHMADTVSSARIKELEALGLTLLPETWIPPSDAHAMGYYTGGLEPCAVMDIVGQSDVSRITSAETQAWPSPDKDASPGGG